MANQNPSSLMADEHQIANLLIRWGHARDSGDWETLAGCFHDDATIHISWISASAKEFVARSRAMAAARKTGAHTKHLISGPWIQVKGDRAFSQCHANLYGRYTIKGQQFDTQNWLRFFDLLERRDRVWRIVKRTAVYEKDRIDPVDSCSVPEDFFADIDLSAFPASVKFICYRILCDGRVPSSNIISVYSAEERALKEECEVWLNGT